MESLSLLLSYYLPLEVVGKSLLDPDPSSAAFASGLADFFEHFFFCTVSGNWKELAWVRLASED